MSGGGFDGTGLREAVGDEEPVAVVPPARGSVLHRTSIVVLLVGLLATGSLASAAWAVHGRNEDRLLNQRVREASALFPAAIPSLQTPLAAAAELAEATDASTVDFKRTMKPHVGPAPMRYVSASIWRADGTSLHPLVVVGKAPALETEPPAQIRAVLRRALKTPLLGVHDLLDTTPSALGYSFVSATPPVRYIIYAETNLPADRLSRPQADSAFSGLDYALYLGSQATPRKLLVASRPETPLGGRTASTVVPFGTEKLLLVMRPNGDLGGSLLRLLPVLIAAIGTLVSLGFVVLVERLLRRGDQSERLAAELGIAAEENARLYSDQRSVAQMLQQSLLPDTLPDIEGVDFAVRYEPGVAGLDIGGDWYDVMRVGDHHALLVVGDVSGRGLRAATIMASLRYSIRAYGAQGDSPTEILRKLGRLLRVERDHHFATVLCACLNLEERTLEIASAGHPSPLLVVGGDGRFIEVTVGVPVGVTADGPYTSVTVEVPPNATYLAFTDGLFERRGETVDVGLERLRAAVTSQAGLGLDELLSSVYRQLAETGIHDDTAILGVRWRS
ncbi:MAG: Two component signal transduction histidine kinase [Acidimicrobiales bacterium]|nr:Two component signal transduction histidine kinase [Acidimicrobiales bacterium]